METLTFFLFVGLGYSSAKSTLKQLIC